jgi:hypothetical protein
MHDNPVPQKVKFKVGLGHFGLKDFERLSRLTGGLVPKEDIGEIFNATKNNPGLILFLLRAFVKNPRRISIRYWGKSCRLLDYPANPQADVPLVVSLNSGTVLSESWGEIRGDYGRNGIFDAVHIIKGLMRSSDFPRVYKLVRAAFEEFKRLPVLSEAEARANAVETVYGAKARCFPYLPASGKTFSATRLWKALPIEVREEEFGGSFRRFSDFLKDLAEEDPTEGPFRVERTPNGHGIRFRIEGIHSSISVSSLENTV